MDKILPKKRLVSIITPACHPSLGGIEEQITTWSLALIDKGFEVIIFCRNYKQIEDTNASNKFTASVKIISYSNIIELFFRINILRSSTWIMVRQYYSASFFLGLLKRIGVLQCKTFIFSDSSGEHGALCAVKKSLRFSLLHKLYFWAVAGNSYLNGTTKHNEITLRSFLKPLQEEHKITRFYNVFDRTTRNNKQKFLDPSVITYLYIGRLEEKKGIFDVIKAFKNLKDSTSKLDIIGYGTEYIENSITEIIKDNKRIAFLGKKHGKEKNEIFEQSHILLFPTYYQETQPIVLMEAVEYGLHIITCGTGNTKELYGDSVIYVQPKNIKMLTKEMIKTETIIKEGKSLVDYKQVKEKTNISHMLKALEFLL